MSIEELISEIEDMLENSWGLPMSGGRVVINAKNLRKILEDIRLNLPQEIVQAQKIISERNRIIENAKTESDTMLRVSEEKIKNMVSQTEITKAAHSEAEKILGDANTKSKEIKKSANEYVEELMKRLDETITQNLVEVRKARQALQSEYKSPEQ